MPRSLSAIAIAAATAASLALGVATAGAQDIPPETVLAPISPATTSPASAPGGGGENREGEEDLAELARLSAEAGALGEVLHLARQESEQAARERDRLARAAGVAASRAELADGAALRDQSVVDHLAAVTYRGGAPGATRAAALAASPHDLVRRLDTIRRLAGATTSALDASRAASAEAELLGADAVRAATAARDSARAAQERTDDLLRRSAEMRERIDEVRHRVDALTDSQRARWAGGPVMPEGYIAPPVDDVNSSVLRIALTRLGAPYSWGATGPSEFDCSGLMVWAYAGEGKTLPRSSQAQAVAGAPVAMADIRPGDLVIYHPDATHVGMYAGDGLVLHAPTYGVPVRLERVEAMPIHGIRRY